MSLAVRTSPGRLEGGLHFAGPRGDGDLFFRSQEIVPATAVQQKTVPSLAVQRMLHIVLLYSAWTAMVKDRRSGRQAYLSGMSG